MSPGKRVAFWSPLFLAPAPPADDWLNAALSDGYMQVLRELHTTHAILSAQNLVHVARDNAGRKPSTWTSKCSLKPRGVENYKMTVEAYGQAYQRGFDRTIRLLLSRGARSECAKEAAQAAWAKGWERINQ